MGEVTSKHLGDREVTVVRQTYAYQMAGPRTVSAAAQLLDKLPNGWELDSLQHYAEGDRQGSHWEAIVTSTEKIR